MAQHSGIFENRRNHKEFYQMVCDQPKAYDIQCICIQRCLESVVNEAGHTAEINVFYYLLTAKSRHWTSEEEHGDELWLTLEECMALEKMMDAVNKFIKMERQQMAELEAKKSSEKKE